MGVRDAALLPILHRGSGMSRTSLENFEKQLRARLEHLRTDQGKSLRAWCEFLDEATGYEAAPNTVRSYESGGSRTIPVLYVIAVGMALNKNPFWIITGVGPDSWTGDEGQSGVLAAVEVLENVTAMLRTGALPPALAQNPIPPEDARAIGEALQTLITLPKGRGRSHGG